MDGCTRGEHAFRPKCDRAPVRSQTGSGSLEVVPHLSKQAGESGVPCNGQRATCPLALEVCSCDACFLLWVPA
jgi:hypothetical protein